MPEKSSAAIMMEDLANSLCEKHSVSVIVPDSGLENGLDIRVNKGVEVIRVSMPSIKNKNYFKEPFLN